MAKKESSSIVLLPQSEDSEINKMSYNLDITNPILMPSSQKMHREAVWIS